VCARGDIVAVSEIGKGGIIGRPNRRNNSAATDFDALKLELMHMGRRAHVQGNRKLMLF